MDKKNNTNILGRNIIVLEEIPSTQKYIKELPEEQKKNGLVVVARKQTDGIGTKGKKWFSQEKENLTFSFILKPNCNIKDIEDLTTIIAKTMITTIKNIYGYILEIKHPNDIMLNSKKVGGVLTEAITNNETVKQIIIGIGLNVNQTEFQEEIKDIATSLKKEFKKEFDILKILIEFLSEFENECINMSLL